MSGGMKGEKGEVCRPQVELGSGRQAKRAGGSRTICIHTYNDKMADNQRILLHL